MHAGRCFVSADAAHVHCPAPGQGLNTGVQDACNLAWKLAMVIDGNADPALLDTYDAERVPIGQVLLASTGEVMNSVMVDHCGNSLDSGQSEQELREYQRQLIRGMSGLAISYPGSALTVPAEGSGEGPRPGERLTRVWASDAQSPGWTMLRTALRTPGWYLLVVADEPSAAEQIIAEVSLPEWVETLTISRRRLDDERRVDPEGRIQDMLATAGGEWFLVRPDGYLSARGTAGTDLGAILHQLSVLRTTKSALA